MTDAPPAHLAFLVNQAPGEVVLNVQVEGEEVQRFRINRDQIFALNAKSADILLRDFR